MREHGASDPERAFQTCQLAHDGWRDECIFTLAETAPMAPAEAAAWCREAGRYTISCLMHLWQVEAAAAKDELEPEPAALRFAESLEWAGDHLDDTLRTRAWSLYYRTGLDPSTPLDAADCDALPDPHPRYCSQGTREALGRGLNVWVRENGPEALMPACELSEADERAAFIGELTGLHYVPAAGLDAVAKQTLTRSCGMQPR